MPVYGTDINPNSNELLKGARKEPTTPNERLQRDLENAGVVTFGAFGTKGIDPEELAGFERSFEGVYPPDYSATRDKGKNALKERVRQIKWLYNHPECCVVSRRDSEGDQERQQSEGQVAADRLKAALDSAARLVDSLDEGYQKSVAQHEVKEIIKRFFKKKVGGEVGVIYVGNPSEFKNLWDKRSINDEEGQRIYISVASPGPVIRLKISGNELSSINDIALTGPVRIGKGSEIQEMSIKKPYFAVGINGGSEVYALEDLMARLESGSTSLTKELTEKIQELTNRFKNNRDDERTSSGAYTSVRPRRS